MLGKGSRIELQWLLHFFIYKINNQTNLPKRLKIIAKRFGGYGKLIYLCSRNQNQEQLKLGIMTIENKNQQRVYDIVEYYAGEMWCDYNEICDHHEEEDFNTQEWVDNLLNIDRLIELTYDNVTTSREWRRIENLHFVSTEWLKKAVEEATKKIQKEVIDNLKEDGYIK